MSCHFGSSAVSLVKVYAKNLSMIDGRLPETWNPSRLCSLLTWTRLSCHPSGAAARLRSRPDSTQRRSRSPALISK